MNSSILIDADPQPNGAPMGMDGGPGRGGTMTPLQVAVRWKWTILAIGLLGAGVAAVLASRMPPQYASSASIEIDGRELQVLSTANLLSGQTLDSDLLHTEMEVLDSIKFAEGVVRSLNLAGNPAFCGPPRPGLLHDIKALYERHAQAVAPPPAPAPCEVPVHEAAKQLLGMVSASNDGRSYIIKVTALAGDPALAANLANAYAAAYIARRRDERNEVSRQAGAWLGTYLGTLHDQVAAADAAVATYSAQHHLSPVHGETADTQRLGELNAQLTAVSGEITQRQSTVSQLLSAMRANGNIEVSAPIIASPLIQSLLQREIELADKQAELQTRFGEAHPQAIAAGAQVEKIRQQIRLEVGKAVASLNGELDALNTRKTALLAQVQAQQASVGAQGQEDMRLQELEREAQSERSLYQTMLTRQKEIDVQQGLQRGDARLVVEAQPADGPSYPHKSMLVVGAFLGSLGLGTCLAFGLNMLSAVFRDADDIEEQTGLRVLGLFAKPGRRTTPETMALDKPWSLQAEALHAVLANLTGSMNDRAAPLGKVILVTSSLPGEGKTSFAVALGGTAVRSGMSAVLLDCDLRRPAVDRLLPGSQRGDAAHAGALAGTLAGGRTAELIKNASIDKRSGLHVLPITGCVPNPHQLLSSPGLRQVVKYLRTQYDIVLLDTPPVLAVADALNLAPLADDVVLLVDWRSTPRRAVAAALQILRRSGAAPTGAVLTKVDLRRYARANPGYGYYSRYAGTSYAAAAGK